MLPRVRPVLLRESPELAHRQVDRCEYAHVQNAGVDSLGSERYRVILRILVHQAERPLGARTPLATGGCQARPAGPSAVSSAAV